MILREKSPIPVPSEMLRWIRLNLYTQRLINLMPTIKPQDQMAGEAGTEGEPAETPRRKYPLPASVSHIKK